ncbi:LysR family transcriptional regulator [Marinobacterium rhizophilum]|uniref:LysR family transcriptional regulator n=1 Tax=Marinobacterium rhizophilum TaxID=420402 RepID=A0ABY5HG95_9GAMM|nr:LysR family transcriptional regulator [Marinobacterium rhizophilum]UTW11383.1 LysR family transcriptional regulator [Marinobacterium rhizophilum]
MARDINISLVRTFLAVAESGGMTSAARALNLTQGAVSQHIRRLEALFEAPLFERENKRVRLTPEGERLMARAYRLIALNDETWQLMTKPAYTGEIRLGVPLDIIRPIMPTIMRRFSREHPEVRLTLVSDMTDTLLAALKQGELDLTLTTEGQPGKDDALLLSDRLEWMGAQGGEACYRTPLPVSLGSEFCAFRSLALEALNRAQIDWLAVCSVGNLESILATIEADMAIAPYLSSLVPDNLTAISKDVGLPALPACYINLRMPASGSSLIARELARHIRQGFAARQAPGLTQG